jgi:hypothetical protein
MAGGPCVCAREAKESKAGKIAKADNKRARLDNKRAGLPFFEPLADHL